MEDRILVLRFKCGSRVALGRIYQKYRKYLLKLAIALLNDVSIAEDVVHDVFVRFAESAGRIRLSGNLKGYLRVCVINAARNKNRPNPLKSCVEMDGVRRVAAELEPPYSWVILEEESERLNRALAQIPYQQREVIVLRVYGGLKFKQIAQIQAGSIKTTLSRYQYGLVKLRSILDSEAVK